ncbi:uncharacterized protein LOC142980177 [Anticarsia gemmatalis]|uniref:uncharacterized protein LOC142980177 n=1 Tax=Anticarsia gemmatalis TaxID=129554 RepID=UPI003F75BEB5
MFNRNVLISIAVLVCVNYVVCTEKPVVDTTHGKISGKVLKTLFKNVDYYGFMGIPFAEPPVGELRFLPPKPIEPWEGILSATKEKPACVQFNNNIKKKQPLGQYGSEDCLYLDIFTPGTDKEQRTVIVFLFNDHFLNSYNKTKDYAPDFFIEEDVVVVTIAHRLSAFGFLSLENEILPGNAGLKDIVVGLEWVKANIEQFGGDPDKITLMGLQGGAAGIDLLIHSKAKHLFRAAILQSGTSWTSAYLQEDVKERAFKLGEMMNITTSSGTTLLKELTKISAENLLSRDLHSSPDDYFKTTQKSVIAFAPVVEKQPDGLITEYPEDSNEKINIPIMLGSNSRDGLETTLHYLIEPRYIAFLKKDFPVLLPRRLKFQFDPREQVFDDITEEIKEFYFPRGEINLKSLPYLITMMGDALTNYAVDYTAKVYAERSTKPVYYYHFDYYSDLSENKKNIMKYSTIEDGTGGAATGDEMCYLFKCPDLEDDYLRFEEAKTEESVMQKKMVKLWTNFAKYGNPTPDDDAVLEGLRWPSYTIENQQYLHIDKHMRIKTDLYKNRFEFWDNFIGKWEKRAVNGIVSESVNKKDDTMGGTKHFIVICVLYLVDINLADIIVETDLGKVAGIEVKSIIPNEKYHSFMGIPYGKAPVGPLRFKAPQPHEGWSDVLSAKKEKQHCTQFYLPIRNVDRYGTCGSDDCLHLSIYTPPKQPTKEEPLNYPVVIFLYNEHFRVSHNASRDYGPDFFVKEEVIVVSISHRLGAGGFLSFEDELLPGNNGLRDVILALKWVQRNIAKFGGNPGSVTLLGADGGAVLADLLLHSPKAKGLFHRIIMQSGTSWNSMYITRTPKEKAKALAKILEKSAATSTSLLAELADVPSERIAYAEPESVDADEGRITQRPTIQFGPVIEPDHPDAILTKYPEDGPLDIDIPIMIGYNSRESLELLDRYLSKPQYLTFADRDFLLAFPTRDDFRFVLNTNTYNDAIQEIKDFYLEEGYVKISKPGEYITYITDMMYFFPIDYTVRKYTNASKSQIYYYSFDYSGELNMRKNHALKGAMTIEGTWGASAGDELCYLFVCKPIKKAYQKVLADEDSEEFTVLRNMVKMWTNFAKAGNPTPPGSDFTWTPATKENKECLVISDELQIKNNLHGDRIEWWDNFTAKYKAKAVDGVIKGSKDEL